MKETIPDSDALRANIHGTLREVVIPERFSRLVTAVSAYYGVRTRLTETLTEYFHEFRNASTLAEGFQTILLGDWPYYERSEDREACFGLLCELVTGLLREPLPADQLSSLLRHLLTWVTGALKSRFAEVYAGAALDVVAELRTLLEMGERPFLERATILKDLSARASAFPALAGPAQELFRAVLLAGYRTIRERLGIIEWARESGPNLSRREETIAGFDFLSEREMLKLESLAQGAAAGDLAGDGFPTFPEIIDRAIRAAARIPDQEDRFIVSLYFLKDDTLGYRQREVLASLLLVVKDLIRPARQVDIERILSRLTGFFRQKHGEFMLNRFQCYEAIGVTIGEAANVKAADHLIEDLLSWEFQHPDVGASTDDWETEVNPFHLPNIRCWMRIIESNPALYERLAIALNVHLVLGGVFISDTDLFQRDITRFLNSDIGPIYFVAKQLMRAFPTYFNDLGAEGELRSVSTQIDEICLRRDSLMHFLRKQIHAESSNRLVDFSLAVLRYWATLDPENLKPFVSANVLGSVERELEWATGPRKILLGLDPRLAEPAVSQARLNDVLEKLSLLSRAEMEARLGAGSCGAGTDSKRVSLMLGLYRLLKRKYTLSTDGLEAQVARHTALSAESRQAFASALSGWSERKEARSRGELVDAILDVMDQLRNVILDPEPSTAFENIYHKRHIAAGIPSMFGSYSEPKFDALGLVFRLETLLGHLLEDIAGESPDPFVNRSNLKRIAADLRRYERVLSLDGINPRSLSSNLRLLEASFAWHGISFKRYRNIFQFLARSVSELSRAIILSTDQILRIVLENDPRRCVSSGLSVDAVSEIVLREVLVSALGIQALDRFVGNKYRQLSDLEGKLTADALTRMMDYDPDGLISSLHEKKPKTDDQMTLGYKGMGLKNLASYGHRVPECFIITGELFSALPAMSYEPMYRDTIDRIAAALDEMENMTGLRLGDPERPLILSIRSGSAISMPGFMTTFVNVGLTPELAGSFAKREGFEWAAWDCYRRFVQTWAMSAGVDRDSFDDLMKSFKKRYSVNLKLDFEPEQMRELALAYRTLAEDLGVEFVDEPFQQVIACVHKVLESWNSPQAKLYRDYLGIADEWGTAVVVQRMVFGNRGRTSGSGVTFTRNPHEPYSRRVRLFGDFTVCSQGEDLVGGLVFPLPVSEAQRQGSSLYNGSDGSLEKDFPEIYEALLDVARDLVSVREYDPQEIEFTFESPSRDDLYILQKRAMESEPASETAVFDMEGEQPAKPMAIGVGVSGGAYAGRVAVCPEHIDTLLAEDPDSGIVLLRPDTVPEDIAMIIRVQGILTARGGSTSHAAVTAKRLGKTAVVDCRHLEVNETRKTARLAGLDLQAGDWLSIDGRTGHVFGGRLPVRRSPVR
ncbi:MAG: hypothetical protein KA072_10910 [Thermoanaerobaculaceae bacterium]|nr:hypothetical protein [Thermoanaerobaculaceae bacterium]